MKLNNKNGFTIVELVIVIAVIAILAAVLIPTFASLIQKANESADIQAVRQMNTYLAVNEVTSDKSILEVYTTLAAGGMTAKDYHPLVSDRYFFWDSKLNRIVYTDSDYKILFPEDVNSDSQNGWYSLSQDIKEESYTGDLTKATADTTIEIETAGQLVKLAKDYDANKTALKNIKLTIKLKNDIDMMGASFHLDGNNIELIADSTETVKITRLVNTNYKEMVNNNAGVPTSYYDQIIFASSATANIKIENVTFENIALGGADSSDVALIKATGGVSNNTTNITLNNVKIVNSEFVGTYRVAGFLAHVDAGTVTMTDCSIENSTLTASVGAVAPIFSMLTTKGTFTNVESKNNTITCTNTESEKVTSLTGTYKKNNTDYAFTVKLPDDGIMTKQGEGSGYRWYPAKSAFGIYGALIGYDAGTIPHDEYPLASGGLDCVETIEAANGYEFTARSPKSN